MPVLRAPPWLSILHLLAWLCLGLVAQPAAATPLVVDGRAAVTVWPAVTLLADPGHALTIDQVLAQRGRFEAPTGTPANLGRVADTIWLRAPVQVPGADPARRVIEFDYPALNHIDVYLVRDGRVQQHQRLGNALPLAERPLQSRSHAAPLLLQPGDSELLLRVRTSSSMVLPITLRTEAAFTRQESQAQLLLGIMCGLAVCMLLYSLSHWIGLRDRMFMDYALLVGGNIAFTLTNFGIGGQYLWPDAPALSMKVSPLAVLVAVAAGTSFMRAALNTDEISKATTWVIRAIGAAALAGLALGLPGWLDYRVQQGLATVLGLAVTAVVLPVAYVRARRGERVAFYMLIGWGFYVCGVFTTAGVLRGYIEPTFWAQYMYPFSTMVEMSAWMAVLGLRVQAIHRTADRARLESETQRVLAHTDALTGLPNRRGLQERLERALHACTPQQVLAVYLLDLDGFKPVNDRYGHDVGDALLVAVGQRLQAQLRGSDVVARLGGDEFVVLAAGLADEAAAAAVGEKLLAAVHAPFDAAGQRCDVGLTVGYALAPQDGVTAAELIKRADAAMYAGKQAGRRRVQHGGRSLVTV